VRLVEVVEYEADEARISYFYKWERFNEVKTLGNKDRGGHGSTGKN